MGAGAKLRLESRIKKFAPHCICRYIRSARKPQRASLKSRDLLSTAYAHVASITNTRLLVTADEEYAALGLAVGTPVCMVMSTTALSATKEEHGALYHTIFANPSTHRHASTSHEPGLDWRNARATGLGPTNPGNSMLRRYRVALLDMASKHDAAVFDAGHLLGVLPFKLTGAPQTTPPPTINAVPGAGGKITAAAAAAAAAAGTSTVFHLIHTKHPDFFGTVNYRVIDSIFMANPTVHVWLHVKESMQNLMVQRMQVYASAGFSVRVLNYSIEATCFRMLKDETAGAPTPGIAPAVLATFKSRLAAFARGIFWFSHETDLLRLCLLYGHGGVYLDTDVIVLKSFAALQNVIGYQEVAGSSLLPVPNPKVTAYLKGETTQVNGAVMKFEARHPFIGACLTEFLTNYKPRPWDYNGPLLLQRVHMQQCGPAPAHMPPNAGSAQDGAAGGGGRGGGGHRKSGACSVTILPTRAFYPMHWRHVTRQCVLQGMASPESQELRRILHNESFAVHLYNQKLRSDQHKSRVVLSSSRHVPVVFSPNTLCKALTNEHCLLCNRPI